MPDCSGAGGTYFNYSGDRLLTELPNAGAGTAYSHDIENRLTAAGGASLSYDPLGRLFYTSGAGGL